MYLGSIKKSTKIHIRIKLALLVLLPYHEAVNPPVSLPRDQIVQPDQQAKNEWRNA